MTNNEGIKRVEFANEDSPIIENDRRVRVELRERFMKILDGLKEKDPQVKFNTDSIAGSEQAIAFTSRGRILITVKADKIFLEQEGKEPITFNTENASDAEQFVRGIVQQYS